MPIPEVVQYVSAIAILGVAKLDYFPELAPLGIRVAAVCPGPVPTEFQALAGIDEHLPPLITCSDERVARETYRGFMRGKRVIVPGLINRMTVALPRLLPRGLVLKLVHANQMRTARRRASL